MASTTPQKEPFNKTIPEKLKELKTAVENLADADDSIDFEKFRGQKLQLKKDITKLVKDENTDTVQALLTEFTNPLLAFDKEDKLVKKNTSFFTELSRKNRSVQFVTIVGDSRSSKSFNANALMGMRDPNRGFVVAKGDLKSCTQGAEVWARVIKDKDNEERIMMVTDSEGFFRENHGKKDKKLAQTLFLMTDILIYQTSKSLFDDDALDGLLTFMKDCEGIQQPQNPFNIFKFPPEVIVTSVLCPKTYQEKEEAISDFFKNLDKNHPFGQHLVEKELWDTFQSIRDKLIFKKIKSGDDIPQKFEAAKKDSKIFCDCDYDLGSAISIREFCSFLDDKLLETPYLKLRPIQREIASNETDKTSNDVEQFIAEVVATVNSQDALISVQKMIDNLIDKTISSHKQSLENLVKDYEKKELNNICTDAFWCNFRELCLRNKVLSLLIKTADRMFKQFNFQTSEDYAYERLEKSGEVLDEAFAKIRKAVSDKRKAEFESWFQEFKTNLENLRNNIMKEWEGKGEAKKELQNEILESFGGLNPTEKFIEIIANKCYKGCEKIMQNPEKCDLSIELVFQKKIKDEMIATMDNLIEKFKEYEIENNVSKYLVEMVEKQKACKQNIERRISAEDLEKVKKSILDALNSVSPTKKYRNEEKFLNLIEEMLKPYENQNSTSEVSQRIQILELREELSPKYEEYCDKCNKPIHDKIAKFRSFSFSKEEIEAKDVEAMRNKISDMFKEISTALVEWFGSQSKKADTIWKLTRIYAKKLFMIEPQQPIYKRFDGFLGGLILGLTAAVVGAAGLAAIACPVVSVPTATVVACVGGATAGGVGFLGGVKTGFENLIANPVKALRDYLIETEIENEEYLAALKTYYAPAGIVSFVKSMGDRSDAIPILKFDEKALKWFWTC